MKTIPQNALCKAKCSVQVFSHTNDITIIWVLYFLLHIWSNTMCHIKILLPLTTEPENVMVHRSQNTHNSFNLDNGAKLICCATTLHSTMLWESLCCHKELRHSANALGHYTTPNCTAHKFSANTSTYSQMSPLLDRGKFGNYFHPVGLYFDMLFRRIHWSEKRVSNWLPSLLP